MRFGPLRRCVLPLAPLMLLAGAPAGAAKLETFGIRTGLSASRLAGNFGESIGGDYRRGLTAAAFWRFRLAGRWSFEPEVVWVAKGDDAGLRFATSGPPTQVTDYSIENRLTYVEFPLLVRLDLPAVRAIRPYLVGGPAPAVKAGASQAVKGTTYTVPGATAPQLQYAFIFEQPGTLGNQREQAVDLGAIGGAGVTLGSGRARLVIEGRYTQGLLDVFEGGVESRNSGFAATLGVEFH